MEHKGGPSVGIVENGEGIQGTVSIQHASTLTGNLVISDDGSVSLVSNERVLEDFFTEDEIKEQETFFQLVFNSRPLSLVFKISDEEKMLKNLEDSSLTYAEIGMNNLRDLFNRIYNDGLSKVYGGKFYSLGSGVGKSVIAAVLLHNFNSCTGIEILPGLTRVSKEVLTDWKTIRLRCSDKKQECAVKFLCGDLTQIDWSDADIAFAYATCFDDALMSKLSLKAERLSPGSYFISVSKM
jgi:Histone methylation protein DOT1